MFFNAYYISKNTIDDLPAIAHIIITRDYDYSFVSAMVQWLARQCGKDKWIVDLGFKSSQSQTFFRKGYLPQPALFSATVLLEFPHLRWVGNFDTLKARYI